MSEGQSQEAKLLAASVMAILEMGQKGATAQEICGWLKENDMDEVAATVINDGLDILDPVSCGAVLTVVKGGKP